MPANIKKGEINFAYVAYSILNTPLTCFLIVQNLAKQICDSLLQNTKKLTEDVIKRIIHLMYLHSLANTSEQLHYVIPENVYI